MASRPLSRRRVRVGIAGAGLWAERAHLPAFSHLDDVEIVAIADPDMARAELLASRASAEQVFQDGVDLLSTGVDAIVVAVPEAGHYRIAHAALEAGVHVLCEKPLARTVAEARRLAHIAREAAVVTKIGFVLRYSPAMQQLRELLDSGAVGNVHSFLFYNNSPQFIDPNTPFHWMMDLKQTGGGAFIEYGCHGLDLAGWLVGEITELCANGRRLVSTRRDPSTREMRKIEVDDICSWLAGFSNGAEGTFHVSWSSPSNFGFQAAVIGDRGILGWRMTPDWPFAEVMASSGPESAFQVVDIDRKHTEGIQWATTWRACFAGCLARRFIDEIRGVEVPEGPNFGDGLKNQLALAAIAESLVERRWVAIGGLEEQS